MLRKCHGRTYEEFDLVAENRTNVPAVDLYELEARIFNVFANDYRAAHAVSRVSFEEAKRRFDYGRKGAYPTTLLTKAEALSLIQRVARDYRILNLSVVWSEFSGKDLGIAKRRGHLVERVSELEVDLKEGTLTDTTVLHEMAHLIDYTRDGESGHGNRFRTTYEELLRKYLSFDITLPRLPKVGTPVAGGVTTAKIEKAPEPEFKMPEPEVITNPVDLDW